MQNVWSAMICRGYRLGGAWEGGGVGRTLVVLANVLVYLQVLPT
jgi:hypothetical protein